MKAGLVALLLVCLCNHVSAARPAQAGSVNPTNAGISQMITDLNSTDANERGQAKRELLIAAKRSARARSRVTDALIKVLNSADTSPETWYDAADLVGNLRATEAVDALISHLDYNDGTVGFSSSHFPAVRALTRIGQPAVPKLIRALSEGRPSVRARAAQALGSIGGAQAREALKRALTTETDRGTAMYIRSVLGSRGN